MKKIQAALAALFVLALSLTAASPAIAKDRVQLLHGLNPPSSWFNQWQRDDRLGTGTLLWNLLGSSSSYAGWYANLTISPVTGLFVAVGPSVTNTVGTVEQFLQEETTAFGGYPSGTGSDALPADPTKVMLQGSALANGPNIGPLSAPGTAGQSIDYLIECAVQTVDQTSQAVNIVSSTGTVTGTTANRDRADTITCQSKAGAAATTGTQSVPATDTGWVGVGYVAVANGTATLTSLMVTPLPPFPGLALGTVAGATAIDTSATNQTKTGVLTLTNGLQIPSSASVTAGTAGGYTTSAIQIANGSGNGSQLSTIGTSGAAVLRGINATGFFFGAGPTTVMTVDQSGDVALNGSLNASAVAVSGAVTGQNVQSAANGSVSSYVPPLYSSTGAASNSAAHIVTGTVATSAGGTVTVTLSASAVFSTSSTYVVTVTNTTGATAGQITQSSGTQFTITGGATQTFNYIAIGY